MQSDEYNQRQHWNRRRLLACLTLLICLAAAVIFILRIYFPTHSKFGGIYEATAFDLNEAHSDRLAVFLRDHLPARVVLSPHFPTRFKEQPRFLHLKHTQMEWSIGGTNTGWLYFHGLSRNSRKTVPGKWEFAPCNETNFMNVTRVPAEFIGATNPRRATMFGESSSTNAIAVSVGQVLFARRTDETNSIYILKLTEQNQNKLVVHYCVTTQQ
jgi:hypothetical protein